MPPLIFVGCSSLLVHASDSEHTYTYSLATRVNTKIIINGANQSNDAYFASAVHE